MTDYLFAQPSYLSGVARLFDFAGALNEYNDASTPEEADILAMHMDHAAVAEDVQQSFARVARTHPEIADAAD